jgi:hypothetical protein
VIGVVSAKPLGRIPRQSIVATLRYHKVNVRVFVFSPVDGEAIGQLFLIGQGLGEAPGQLDLLFA